MPDLTQELVQQCSQTALSDNVLSSKGTETYDVNVSGDYENCTCPGFTYRGRCKHVTALKERLCGWSSQHGEEVQTPQQEMEMVCPKCGGETCWVKVGV
jgi:hypothetical protein